MSDAPAIPRRTEVIRTFKEGGGSVAAVFPIHYPRALFRAFNILPVEVWGPPGVDVSLGASHLQPYVCSIVRNALAFLRSGRLDVADILVVPHACDSLQGLGSILIDFVVPRQPVLPIYLPRGRRESDHAFFVDEFRHLYERLAVISGSSPSDAELLAAIAREEKADEYLIQLHHSRKQLPLGDLDFYRLVRCREYLPAETFMKLAQEALAQALESPLAAVPIVLSGIVPEPMSLLSTLSAMGGMVVADDLACCGRRLYPAGESEDPFRRMAERILNAPPDSTRGNPISERVGHLRQLADRSGGRGIVFYDVKFCEPELFDLPDLRQALQETGIPSLAIEVDINDPLSQQVQTRLESFLEMIQ